MYRHMHQPHVKLGINHNIGLNVLLIKSGFYISYLIKQSKKSWKLEFQNDVLMTEYYVIFL